MSGKVRRNDARATHARLGQLTERARSSCVGTPGVAFAGLPAGLAQLVACTVGSADWQQFDWSSWDTLGQLDRLDQLGLAVERQAIVARAE